MTAWDDIKAVGDELMKIHPDILHEWSLTGDGDTWADTLEWCHAVADYLWHTDPEMIPESWEFHHGAGCRGRSDYCYNTETLWYLNHRCGVTLDDIVHFGNVMVRYASILRAEGRDY